LNLYTTSSNRPQRRTTGPKPNS